MTALYHHEHVAGVAALLQEEFRTKNKEEVEELREKIISNSNEFGLDDGRFYDRMLYSLIDVRSKKSNENTDSNKW